METLVVAIVAFIFGVLTVLVLLGMGMLAWIYGPKIESYKESE